MEKKIKKYGNSVVIVLTPDDLEKNKCEVGDFIKFTITEVTKMEKS